MFAINTHTDRSQYQSNDWAIIVNGIKCKCCKAISEKISPIVQSFFIENENKDSVFVTEIPGVQTILNSGNSKNTKDLNPSVDMMKSIRKMISRLFNGEEIICQEDNYEILLLIGKHFQIQEIIDKIEEYQNYSKTIPSFLKNSIELKEMIKLEKILLSEINERNIEAKVKEYEELIKKIPIICFIHFVISIIPKNNNIRRVNEVLIKLIKKVDIIVPETLNHFTSTVFHKFVFINSKYAWNIDKYDEMEINSLTHQIFLEGLITYYNDNIKINQNEITIPKDFQKYFVEKDDFVELVKENSTQNQNRETKDQFDILLEIIKNDNIESFQNYFICSQIDINSNVKNDFTNRISFLDDDKKCSMIELSAFIGAIKCFTYLYNKQANINQSRLSNFAVAGGNLEIIHICEREECVFNEITLDISIEYHQHQITKWLVETKNIATSESNLRSCILYYNIHAMKYLIEKGININQIAIYFCESNNIILFKWLSKLLECYSIEINYQDHNKSVLHIACERNNVEIVKPLMLKDNIDVNSIFKVIIGYEQLFIMSKIIF